MKQIYLFFLAILLLAGIPSKSQTNEIKEKDRHFFVGMSYVFMSLDLQIKDMTINTMWAGQDMGSNEISSEEIDELNAIGERTRIVNAICLVAGLPIINKSDSKFYFGGTVSAGVAHTHNSIYNLSTENQEYTYSSGLSKPFFGIDFDIVYQFTPTWSVAIKPLFSTTMGSSKEITDNINLVPENFTQVLDDKYTTFYERVSLLANFKSGKFKLFAGPGFFWLQSDHEYVIERINQSNGDVIRDEINTKTTASSFIDGNVGFEWKIFKSFSIYTLAGVGKDIFINSGMYLNF